MGGLATEIDDASTDIVIEGAHFSDTGTAKMSRRHRLHSEASYRFERGVDRELPPRATARAAALLASLGGATVVPGLTHGGGAGHAGDDRAGGRLPGPGGGRRLRPRHRRRPAGGGRLRRPLHPGVARADHRPVARAAAGRRRPPRQARPSAHGPAGDPAVLASRPDRPGRPGRGGHPARGLQQHPGPPAPRDRGPRPHPPAAGAAGRRPHPRRRRVRRGPLRAVRPGQRRRPADARRPTTRAAPRSRSPTRSATTSRCCARPCCPASSASSRRTSAAASATSRCSRPAWSSCPGRARRGSRRSSPPTGGRPRRSWRRSTRRCRSSRRGSPGCWPGTASCPARGVPDGPRPGPTRSRRPARWPPWST